MDKAGAILVLSAAFESDPQHGLPEDYIEKLVTGAVEILYERFNVILLDEYEAETSSAMNFGDGLREGSKLFDSAKGVIERYYNAQVQRDILDDPFPEHGYPTMEQHNAVVVELRESTDVVRQLLGLSPLWDTGPAPRDCE